ncbi:hypothetical protein SLS60_007547 [Paraconiothyrium brasiliense]|uniref:Uncharacterized protein n=1 Tax=Paraconiothyrium brasiliense TaxID=300254 RepID=A0ABR3R6C1_9PLEO
MELLRQVPISNGGPRFEARAFAAMYHLPYVTRSAEFANVDGVLDCKTAAEENDHAWASLTLAPGAIEPASAVVSFADRFYALIRFAGAHHADPILVPFDVKSSSSHRPRDQQYHTSVDQRRCAAFYICFCAADPAFVEVIPNGLAGEQLGGTSARGAAVNRSCEALVEPRAHHFLSPCNALYRMPVALLPVALDNIRACALDRSLRYTNPWTKARFGSWKPFLLRSVERLIPNEDTQQAQFTAYEGTVRIQRAIRNARLTQKVTMLFDFVLHQPRLADFKLITSAREALVQYKIDYPRQSRGPDLSTVEVARMYRVKAKPGKPAKEEVRYYFTALERFDYLLYEFQFPVEGEHAKPDQWDTWFFFLPEKVLPDRFYTTQNVKDSFTDAAFADYWLRMDPEGNWVKDVYAIMQANPEPRRPGDRPLRVTPSKRDEDEDEEEEEEGEDEKEVVRLPSAAEAPAGAAPAPRDLGWFYKQFFETIMDCCAQRTSGLLVVLARDHPLGDFAYCRYRWSRLEQKTYRETGEEFTDRVPRLAEQLHTRSAIADYTVAACGPMIFEPNNDAWAEVWALLDKFSGSGTFHFPETMPRQAERYQLSVQELHQHLADEYEELEGRYLERFRA